MIPSGPVGSAVVFVFFQTLEVGSIDPLLEGTGDQSMGCLVMHPDEADLTAGEVFWNVFFSEKM